MPSIGENLFRAAGAIVGTLHGVPGGQEGIIRGIEFGIRAAAEKKPSKILEIKADWEKKLASSEATEAASKTVALHGNAGTKAKHFADVGSVKFNQFILQKVGEQIQRARTDLIETVDSKLAAATSLHLDAAKSPEAAQQYANFKAQYELEAFEVAMKEGGITFQSGVVPEKHVLPVVPGPSVASLETQAVEADPALQSAIAFLEAKGVSPAQIALLDGSADILDFALAKKWPGYEAPASGASEDAGARLDAAKKVLEAEGINFSGFPDDKILRYAAASDSSFTA